MNWANFLHFYQPAGQQGDILEAVVTQSYRPILEGLVKRPKVKITLNIAGALLELFDKYGHHDLLKILRRLGTSGNIEFTSSAKYHAFLPFLTEEKIARQIKTNDETNKFYLGEAYRPQGFFPPEMAYHPKLAPIINELGFKWLLLDEIALSGQVGQVKYDRVYQIAGTDLIVFFRERRLSNLIMSAVVRSQDTLYEALKPAPSNEEFILTAMDGETFGHHRPGLEIMLFDLLDSPEVHHRTISHLIDQFPRREICSPVACTWASSSEDIADKAQFLSWSDPENRIHHFQKELLDLVVAEFDKINEAHQRYPQVRERMDAALASDHFFWASGKPWWSLEMIEEGAYRLLDTLRMMPDIPAETLQKAGYLYEQIVTTAFNWQRTGKIRQMAEEQKTILRIPFKDRTIGRGGAERGVYYAFMKLMKRLEEQAVKRGEYEQAILWRDAQFKLRNKLDIYDTVNAIDLLRVELPHDEVEKTIRKYKEKYARIRGGQPEQRGS